MDEKNPCYLCGSQRCYPEFCSTLHPELKLSYKFFDDNKKLKGDQMTNLIKEIRKIIGEHDSSKLTINIHPKEIRFEIYDTEIPIIINKKNKQVYLDCETCNNHLCFDMLDELSKIVKLLENNIEIILEFLQ